MTITRLVALQKIAQHWRVVWPWCVACGLLIGLLPGCAPAPQVAPAPVEPVARPVLDPAAQRVAAVSSAAVGLRDDDWLADVAAESGVQFTYQTGREAGRYSLLETLGGGVGLIDVDQDGDLDLLFPGGGTIAADTGVTQGVAAGWFRNRGNGTFEDASQSWNPPGLPDYSHGCAAGDVDRDGFPDVFLACYGTSRLWSNQRGQGLRDVTVASGVTTKGWDTAAVIVDLTGDGFPEIYVTAYVDLDTRTAQPCASKDLSTKDVCPPQSYVSLRDRLYWNRGDGTFEDISEQAGLLPEGRGLGVLTTDFNRDGWPDLYIANDGDPNHLYLGGGEWPLREVGLLSGSAVNARGAAEGSMGIDYADVNGDGAGDLLVTNNELEDNSLYLGDRAGTFSHASTRFGLAGTGRAYVAFGTGLHDFNHDGWPDLHVMNGHVLYRGLTPFQQPAFLYRNAAGTRFEDLGAQAGAYFRQPHVARGTAVGDWNGDGAPDLAISQLGEPVALLQNQQLPAAWISAELHPRGGDPQGVGAEVSLMAGQSVRTIPIRLGSSFASHAEPWPMFAVEQGQATVTLRVRWSSGREEMFPDLAVNRRHRLVEGTGR